MERINVVYKITFYSYWHIGGKDGANMKVDSAVLKDRNGLPYIGGKTMKGLIKDGARFIENNQPGLFETENFKDTICGLPDRNYSRIKNNVPINKFTSARIEQELDKSLIGLLIHDKSSVELTDNKQAKVHSLRNMEMVIPVELFGTIENFDSSIKDLKICLSAVKKLGLKRNRSLGRCKIEIVKLSEGVNYE